MGTQFLLLGPLAVRVGETPMAIPAAKHRAVLAALLLRANQVVTVDDLTEVLWGEDVPTSARTVAQNYVMRLRKALGPAGPRITTRPRGYLILVEPGELDLDRFEDHLRRARTAARKDRWQDASRHAAAALALWRGEPLTDSDLLTVREGPRLAELRLQALEMRSEAELQQGRHSEAISELRQLTAGYPLRERLHRLLMLALYRDGRQGEALAAYQHARKILVEELGAEPGPDLQELHRQILTADPSLTLTSQAAPAGSAAGRARPVPRQLPAAVADFTGRAAELAALTGMLDQAGTGGPGTVVISAIGGTAGVGKTALAVHWAHQVAGQFPDGQLFVNLRGYDPGEPVSAGDALAGFLRAMSVPATEIPDGQEERSGLYRSKMAGRRMLVVLDNARDSEHVRPLLPGDPACIAVVTSRDTLAGLVAADGARRLDLDVLPLAEAIGLLRSLIGARVDEDPAAAAKLASLCARLPLALRVAAELAVARLRMPLAELAAELAEAQLEDLDAGEERADVRAVFSWSVHRLPSDAAEAFTLIGLHPGESLDAHALAALACTSVPQARRVLAALQRASLLQEVGSGRYGMHDLLHAYAREQAADRGVGEHELTRLFDYYRAAAVAAMDSVFPAQAGRRRRIPSASAQIPVFPGKADGRAWLDSELANLVAVVVHCADHGWPQHAGDLAAIVSRYLWHGSHVAEAHTIWDHALRAARQSGDVAAEAMALNGLGTLRRMKGQIGEAIRHYQAALGRFRDCGDRGGEARTLNNLGSAESEHASYRSAVCYYREAIAAYEAVGDDLGAAMALCGMSGAEIELDSCEQAAEHLDRALHVFRDVRDELNQAHVLGRLGELSLRRDQPAQAAEFFDLALATYRQIDSPVNIGIQLYNLGNVCLRQGNHQQAICYLRQALAQFQQADGGYGQIQVLKGLAEAMHGVGDPVGAHTELEIALRVAAETDDTYQQASVHSDLAESHHSAGQHEQARRHWQQALELYAQLGLPEADQIRSRLTDLQASPPH